MDGSGVKKPAGRGGTAEAMNLSVVILSRNQENMRACVAAVRRTAGAVEIVIVDDGLKFEDSTTNDLYPYWRRWGVKPFIFGRNANIGIRAAFDADVFLLNDDALMETAGGLAKLQEAAAANPQFGIVSAAVNGPACAPDLKPLRHSRGGIRPIQGKMVPFVAVLIPRRTIDSVGLLDECFTDYGGEDDSYCYRVRRAGLAIGVFDGCTADHGSLESTFRPDGKSRDVSTARRQFRELHGFEMGTR